MINDVTLGAVHTHTHTHTSISNEIEKGLCAFSKKSVSFFSCLKSFKKGYVKIYNKINKDSINLYCKCAF